MKYKYFPFALDFTGMLWLLFRSWLIKPTIAIIIWQNVKSCIRWSVIHFKLTHCYISVEILKHYISIQLKKRLLIE